jgi:ketosteroid isomerase-like protein
MKIILAAMILTGVLAIVSTAQKQSDLEKLVQTEQSFAKYAAENGTRAAFLKFLADDGIIFQPKSVNGKEFWIARPESKSLLSWSPIWADISSNGVFGYTTGGWEFRAEGKDGVPTAFGEYFTIWRRNQDAEFKAVIDIGISHEKTSVKSAEWTSPKTFAAESNAMPPRVEATADAFFDLARTKSAGKAYAKYVADDAYFLRDASLPIVGKKSVLSKFKNANYQLLIPKNVVFARAGNFAYISEKYQLIEKGNSIENGNFVQVWKFADGNWKLAFDVFSKNSK